MATEYDVFLRVECPCGLGSIVAAVASTDRAFEASYLAGWVDCPDCQPHDRLATQGHDDVRLYLSVDTAAHEAYRRDQQQRGEKLLAHSPAVQTCASHCSPSWEPRHGGGEVPLAASQGKVVGLLQQLPASPRR